MLADTSLKILGTSQLPAYEVIGLVGLATAILLLLYAAVRGNVRDLWPKRPLRQFLRSCLDVGNGLCVVVALRHLPLALFYILVFAAPMVTTLMAAVFLKERLEWKTSAALLAGFAGVVVAVNPLGVSHPGDRIGYLACLVCVTCFSANMVWSRAMAQTESAHSLTFFSGAATAALTGVAMLYRAAPVPPKLASVLVATGLFSALGSLCFFVALRHASTATVSQFHYSQLLTGTLIAYLVWHETLTLPMLAGAVLIIAAGAYTATRSYAARGSLPLPDRPIL